MFKNYFKTAVRNLLKNKFYSLLNLTGLAVGLATCLLIFLYVSDELSFDKYHKNAGRIYRVNNEVKFGGNYFDIAQAPALMGPTMVREIPRIEQYTRLRWYGSFLVRKGNENVGEGRVGYADSTFFDIFSIPVLAGNPKTALVEPHSIVLTESRARKYFNNIDVVGKNLIINDTGNYKITAVISDIPKQTHFNFDFFIPMSENPDSRSVNWLSENYSTYVLLKENTDTKNLVNELDAMLEKHTGPSLQAINLSMDDFKKEGGYVRTSLTPVSDIHLHSGKLGELDANGNLEVVYIFSAIALLILLIACVNFMNLSTARSSNRAKEVGVRKVLGSLKKNLIQQFLMESMLISIVALIAAIVIAWSLLPYFNDLSGKAIDHSELMRPAMMLALVVLMVIVGLLAGSYPAFFLSAFQPIQVLKGKLSGGFKRSWLQNALVVGQFVISIMLIFGTIVIYTQLNFIRNKDLGYNRQQVLIIQNTSALGQGAEAFRNELTKLPGVKNASLSGYLPVNYTRGNDAFFTSPAMDQNSSISLQVWSVDENYIPTLDIKLLNGRNFSKDFLTDSTAIIVNEAAARLIDGGKALNKKLYRLGNVQDRSVTEYHIVGVIKNFHFSSLKDAVTPLSLLYVRNNWNISVRIDVSDVKNLVAAIGNKWKQMAPGQPFGYTFMDDDFNNLYTAEQRTGKIFITFAVIAIVIACLGLFGLITYAAEQRIKEIGIRKVLGASVPNITGMLSLNFLKLVLVAGLIAFPLSWWAMNKWLQDFAYRVSIEWWIFLITALIALFIAFSTVYFQAMKAAMANPVKSLRSE
ncbi:MAG: ABC transporter permease [Chitinophagaceae bacterium]|nr:ABC transporter permease [Chitinophagaceae bacterium]